MIDADKLKAFLAEYRDLVHRHGLGIEADEGKIEVGKVVEVSDPDAHVAEIAPVEVPTQAP